MGCMHSKHQLQDATEQAVEAEIEKRMYQLVRPACYQDQRPSFYAAYARAARRYGFDAGRYAGFCKRNNVVVKLKTHGLQDIDHEVPAESVQNGNEYVVPVKIGSPGITANLDFDTGSSDLWIWSSELANASKYSKTHNIYNPKKSKTAKKASGTWQISYGDGSSASGDVYTDTISVAGVTIRRQAVECASHLSSSFLSDGGNDGLLGLAWPALNTVSPHAVKTPIENMIDQKLIDEPLFTVKLSRGNEPGFYSFGYIDHSVTTHHLHYTPVDSSQGFWQVKSYSYSVNGQIIDRPGNTTILDTGTTLLLVDDDVLRSIYDQIHGAVYDDQLGGWKYPVDTRLPEISFAIGDYLFTLHEEDVGFGPADHGYIMGGIQSRGNQDFDIFGDVFLKCVYVVFNQGEKTVGVAQRD
ncbi:acid protease [Trametopsis cervina]|nr:acid protease [Trametopsis cervina]